MAKDINVKITGDSRDLERALNGASKSASGFGRTLAKAAKVGLVALGAGMAVGAAKSVKAASDLEESMNAIRVVFGKATKSIVDFGQTSATSVGLSQRAFNQAVTPIGAALQNVGLGAQEAANQSINLTKRAADMASVFNTDVSTALEAIQAALRGEADPIERFGIGLSDAAVRAQAAKMGMKELDGQLSAGQKTRARLALFFQQSNKFAGDFANTSGSLANQQRILRARLEDLAAKIGERLLPMLTNAAEKAGDFFNWLDKIGRKKTTEAKVKVILQGIGDTARGFWDAIFGPQFERKLVEVRPGMTKKIMQPTDSLAQQFGGAIIEAVQQVDWISVGNEIRKGFLSSFKAAAEKVDPMNPENWSDTPGRKIDAWFKENFNPQNWGWDSDFTSLMEMIEGEAQAASGTVGDKFTKAMNRAKEAGRRAMGDVRLQLGNVAASGLKAKDRIEEVGAAGRNAAPGLGAAARTAAALASAWGRVVSLPSAKAFEIRFRSITTVETNRLQGRRAMGGPVAGGAAYLVGERGPEVFVPNTSGRVVSNAASSGPQSINLVVDGATLARIVRFHDGRWAMANG